MNHLCVSTCEAIKALALKGWSGRRIARELAVNRETVARYLGPSKPAIPPPGSAPPPESNPAIPPLGSEDTGTGSAPKPAIPTAGSRSGRRSLCEVHQAEITLAIEQGLSAQRIYQDLVISHAFAGSYTSVKRFVHQRRSSQELPFRRWESEPGEETQIDFGQGSWGDRLLGAFDGVFRDHSASVAVISSECPVSRGDSERSRSPRKTQATSHRKPISGLIPRDRLTVSKRL